MKIRAYAIKNRSGRPKPLSCERRPAVKDLNKFVVSSNTEILLLRYLDKASNYV